MRWMGAAGHSKSWLVCGPGSELGLKGTLPFFYPFFRWADLYIPRESVQRCLGGEINRSLARIWLKTRKNCTALRRNGVAGLGALAWKNFAG